MRKICHQGLAKLVGTYSSLPMNNEDLSLLTKGSIDPDLEKRMDIEKNLQNISEVIPILFEWLIEHTIGAKKNAKLHLRKAKNAYLADDSSWIYFLGQSFHYITDWGTPYHIPISVANPTIPNTIFGALISTLIGVIVNRKKDSKKMLKNAIKWGLIGAGTTGGASLIKLYLDHNKFEEQCDEYWNRYETLIIRKFTSQKKNFNLPSNFKEAYLLFDEKMNNLRKTCCNISPDWILSNDGNNFADYMVQIANLLNYAIQIITYY